MVFPKQWNIFNTGEIILVAKYPNIYIAFFFFNTTTSNFWFHQFYYLEWHWGKILQMVFRHSRVMKEVLYCLSHQGAGKRYWNDWSLGNSILKYHFSIRDWVLNFFRKKEIFFKNKFGKKLKPQGRANYF